MALSTGAPFPSPTVENRRANSWKGIERNCLHIPKVRKKKGKIGLPAWLPALCSPDPAATAKLRSLQPHLQKKKKMRRYSHSLGKLPDLASLFPRIPRSPHLLKHVLQPIPAHRFCQQRRIAGEWARRV